MSVHIRFFYEKRAWACACFNVKNLYFGGIKMKKKILSLLLSLAMVFGLTACGGGGGGGNVELVIAIADYGFGIGPITSQIERFNELYPDIDVILDTNSQDFDPKSDDIHIYHNEISKSEGFANGWFLNIDDLVTGVNEHDNKTIESKIPEQNRWFYQYQSDNANNPNNGKYFSTPGYSHFFGLTYDKDLWEKRGYFLADCETEYSIDSSILYETFYFTKNASEFTVGPNGISGDQDDGLPSSLHELIALCEYITMESGDTIDPFMFPGVNKSPYYSNYLAHALTASLQGYENTDAMCSFQSEEAWVVVDVDDSDPIFPGWEDSPGRPIVAKVKITEQSGYYSSWSVEKYYAIAFFEMCHKLGWFTNGCYGSNTHYQTQYRFIYGDLGQTTSSDQGAMLVEGSYWHNESLKKPDPDNYAFYKDDTKGKPGYPADGMDVDDRHLYWMSLPVNIETTVTGEDKTYLPSSYAFEEEAGADYTKSTIVTRESAKGEAPTFVSAARHAIYYNARFENDPEVLDAMQKWILFSYCDSELSKYTAQGCYRFDMNYDVAQADVQEYSYDFDIKFWELVATANVVDDYDNNKTLNANLSNYRFCRNNQDGFFGWVGENKNCGSGVTKMIQYFNDNTKNPSTMNLFTRKTYNAKEWEDNVLEGGGGMAHAHGLKYPQGHEKAGQWIVCELNKTDYTPTEGSW